MTDAQAKKKTLSNNTRAVEDAMMRHPDMRHFLGKNYKLADWRFHTEGIVIVSLVGPLGEEFMGALVL